MAGVFIYKNYLNQYYGCIISDDEGYQKVRENYLFGRGIQILWEKENVSLERMDNNEKTIEITVNKLNNGQEVNLEKELDLFFQ